MVHGRCLAVSTKCSFVISLGTKLISQVFALLCAIMQWVCYETAHTPHAELCITQHTVREYERYTCLFCPAGRGAWSVVAIKPTKVCQMLSWRTKNGPHSTNI